MSDKPINNDSITLLDTLMPKIFKSTCKKLWYLFVCKKSTSFCYFYSAINRFFLLLLQTCYFWNSGNAWPSPSKIKVSICGKLFCLSVCEKSISSHTFFLRYCKQIPNLLIWVISAFLDTHTHTHLKWSYQFEETFDVYLKPKNQLHPFFFPWDISNILQTCYFGYFRHAWLLTPKVILSTCRKVSCLPAGKKINFIPHVFLEILHRYVNILFYVIWACLATHAKNYSINLHFRKLRFLSASNKQTSSSSFISFMRFRF